jgi:hypothetical protein
LVVIDFISVEFFSFAVQRWESGLKAKEFTRNLAEYPDRYGYLWKAAAIISTEICEAVLGMAASLSNFAKEKTRQNRNEPETAKMTHGQDEEKFFPSHIRYYAFYNKTNINNIYYIICNIYYKRAVLDMKTKYFQIRFIW